MPDVKIAVVPDLLDDVAGVVGDAGAEVVSDPAMADAIIWVGGANPADVAAVVSPTHRWVSLSFAGIERYLDAGVIDTDRVWTCTRGVYAEGCAEHAVALLLACARRLAECARATTWIRRPGARLAGERVVVLGTGTMGQAVARMLDAIGAVPVGVSRSGAPAAHFAEVRTGEALLDELRVARGLVVTVPSTAETKGLVGAEVLDAIGPDGYLVNVSRGDIVDTDALVDALSAGRLGAAGLDVTEPEPLPDGHPLWTLPTALITPHVANPATDRPFSAHRAEYLAHVAANTAAFVAGRPLEGVIDPNRGY